MNETTQQCKENAIKATMEYRNELLKEVLLLKEKLCKRIDLLCETGIDRDQYICLEDAEVEQDIRYTVLTREMVINLKTGLKTINETNATQIFKDITKKMDNVDLYNYQEFEEMSELCFADMMAEHAVNSLS